MKSLMTTLSLLLAICLMVSLAACVPINMNPANPCTEETTSHAASRLDAIFAVNGCYSAPYLNYTVVRNGELCNGGGSSTMVFQGQVLNSAKVGQRAVVDFVYFK